MGELDIELSSLQRAFGHGLGGVRRLQGLAALIDNLFGNSTGLDQGQAALEIALGKLRLGARIRELTVRLLGNGFKRSGIDDIKKIAGIDECTVTKFHAGNEPADPGANLDLLHRLEPSGELVPIRNGAFGWLRDRDRRCGGSLQRRLFPAAGQSDGQHNEHRPKTAADKTPADKTVAETNIGNYRLS